MRLVFLSLLFPFFIVVGCSTSGSFTFGGGGGSDWDGDESGESWDDDSYATEPASTPSGPSQQVTDGPMSRPEGPDVTTSGDATGEIVDLRYKWPVGRTIEFDYREDGSANTMGMRMSFAVASKVSLTVLEALPGGKARVRMTVREFDVFEDSRKVATLRDLPEGAREAIAEVDAKGKAEFVRYVTLVRKEDSYIIATAVSGRAAGSASGSVAATVDTPYGEFSVSASASVSADSGQVTVAGSSGAGRQVSQTQIAEEDPTVDIVPRSLFQMLELPEDPIALGQQVTLSMPIGDTVFAALAGSQGEINFRVTSDSDINDDTTSQMGGGMSGMMDMQGMMGGSMGGVSSTMSADIKGRFDPELGFYRGVEGTITTEISAQGMSFSMTSDATISNVEIS